jgi:DNA-binding MarR family transcriptional regulator
MTTSASRTSAGAATGVAATGLAASGSVEADLGWALGAVFRSYVKVATIAMDTLPGGPRGYQVLSAIVHAVPRTQLVLAQQLGIDRTVMTYLLDALVSAGLVERQSDPADRRARRVVATDAGRAELQRLEGLLRHAEDAVLSPLDGADRATLRDLLCRLAQHAQSHDPVSGTCQVLSDLSDQTLHNP